MLAACGGGGDAEAEASTVGPGPDEDAYVEAVRSGINSPDSDKDLLYLGYSICDAFSAGEAPRDIVVTGMESGFTRGEIKAVMIASIDSLCTDHRDLYDEISD